MLHIHLNSLRIGHRELPAFGDLQLTINEGSACLLRGPSGLGKSTFLEFLDGGWALYDSDLRFTPIEAVRFHWARDELVLAKDTAYAYTIAVAHAPQFSSIQFFGSTVLEELVYPLELAGIPGTLIDERIDRLLEQLPLADLLDESPEHLSGGQRQLVSLASALARQPRVLLLDEPTTFISDGLGSAFWSCLSFYIQQGFVGSCVLATHRRVPIDHRLIPLPGSAPEDYSPPAANPATAVTSPSERPPENETAPRLVVRSGVYGWKKRKSEVRIAEYHFRAQRVYAVTGDNAAGKSTLVQGICGLVPYVQQQLEFDGQVVEQPRDLFPSRLGICFQNPMYHIVEDTLQDEIQSLLTVGIPEETVQQITSVICAAGIETDANVYNLSAGQRRFAYACFAMAADSIVVLDEPLWDLDDQLRATLLELLRIWVDDDRVAIICTHDVATLQPLSPQVIRVHKGRVLGVTT